MVSVSNNPSQVGVSEAIVSEPQQGDNLEIEWSFEVPKPPASQKATRKPTAFSG